MRKPKPGAKAAFEAKIEANIARTGLSIIMTGMEVPEGMITLVYSVGLVDSGFPEIVVFGLPHEVAWTYIEGAHMLLKNGTLKTDEPIDGFGDLPVVFKRVLPEKAPDHLRIACSRAGKAVPALQIVWADPAGNFPWQPDHDKAFSPMQPLIFENLH